MLSIQALVANMLQYFVIVLALSAWTPLVQATRPNVLPRALLNPITLPLASLNKRSPVDNRTFGAGVGGLAPSSDRQCVFIFIGTSSVQRDLIWLWSSYLGPTTPLFNWEPLVFVSRWILAPQIFGLPLRIAGLQLAKKLLRIPFPIKARRFCQLTQTKPSSMLATLMGRVRWLCSGFIVNCSFSLCSFSCIRLCGFGDRQYSQLHTGQPNIRLGVPFYSYSFI